VNKKVIGRILKFKINFKIYIFNTENECLRFLNFNDYENFMVIGRKKKLRFKAISKNVKIRAASVSDRSKTTFIMFDC
jgi:hypothetical protein